MISIATWPKELKTLLGSSYAKAGPGAFSESVNVALKSLHRFGCGSTTVVFRT